MLFCPRNLEQRKLTELSILAIKQMVLGAFLCTTIQKAKSAKCYFPVFSLIKTKIEIRCQEASLFSSVLKSNSLLQGRRKRGKMQRSPANMDITTDKQCQAMKNNGNT